MDFLAVGDKAPDFTLLNHEGEDVSFKDFSGKKLVIWFFPKANTPGWIMQGEGFRDEFQKFQDKGYEIIGVSADPPAKQKKFVDKFNFQFTMLCDESHEMLEAYKVWGLKKFMGREYMGISRTTFVIDEDGLIIDIITKVKTKAHAKQILN